MIRYALLLLLVSMASAGDAVQPGLTTGRDPLFPMRWRTYCDVEDGFAFRYPYPWLPKDQYVGDLFDSRRKEQLPLPKQGEKITAKQMEALLAESRLPDARAFGFTVAEPPKPLTATATAEEVGNHVAGAKLEWKPYEYYSDAADARHRGRKWSPVGITAVLGQAKGRCALVVRHGERWSGVVLRGAPGDEVNAELIASAEVLVPGGKSVGGKPPAGRTWREAQTAQGNVFAVDGKVIGAQQAKAVGWSTGWEIETAHYHVTGNASPARLAFHGQYLEALYRSYARMYEPERMPPYKFEVHIFDTCDQFERCLRAWAIPNFSARNGGGIIGGLFFPGTLALWVYEESGKLGGKDFSVEHVTAHECSHQFLHVTCNGSDHVPTWINEGLAVYFEAGVFVGGEFQVRLPMDRIRRLREQYSALRRPLAPLHQYLDHHGQITASMYGEVFAMIHHFVFGFAQGDPMDERTNPGLKRFREYWRALKKGEDGNKAFERIFMADMIKSQGSREAAVAEWQRLLVEYVTKDRRLR